jgi:hypothetical protein
LRFHQLAVSIARGGQGQAQAAQGFGELGGGLGGALGFGVKVGVVPSSATIALSSEAAGSAFTGETNKSKLAVLVIVPSVTV